MTINLLTFKNETCRSTKYPFFVVVVVVVVFVYPLMVGSARKAVVPGV